MDMYVCIYAVCQIVGSLLVIAGCRLFDLRDYSFLSVSCIFVFVLRRLPTYIIKKTVYRISRLCRVDWFRPVVVLFLIVCNVCSQLFTLENIVGLISRSVSEPV